MAGDKLQVYLVDDHQFVLDGVNLLLMGVDNLEVAGMANNGDELESLIAEKAPDVIVMDIRMPGRTGIEMTAKLKQSHPEIRILVFSGNTPDEEILAALEAGADGFLPKNAKRDELITALQTVAGGKVYYSASVTRLVMQQMQQLRKKQEAPPKIELTEREIEIIQAFAEGLRYKEIADKLHISPNTVESHKVKILRKLGVSSIIEMVVYAMKKGLLEV